MNKIHNIPKELEMMLVDFYMMSGEKRYASDNWVNQVNNRRVFKLIMSGYKNFMHTFTINSCAWYDDPPQFDFLIRNLSPEEVANAKRVAKRIPITSYAGKKFNLITLLLWQYVKNQGLQEESKQLSEPAEGPAPAINFEGRLISQGLAHSLLEYNTVCRNTDIDSIKSIMSIGSGYGRTSSAFLRLLKIQKCILVDIPPALYMAQRYLSSLFPKKTIFKYRKFASFEKIEKEFKNADIVFLMPWQIELLPEKSVDLIFAIDSFDDMEIKTIKRYLKYIDILGKQYFYMKCWKEWKSEDRIIKWGKDYPIPANWKILLNRECRVQTDIFESLYQLS